MNQPPAPPLTPAAIRAMRRDAATPKNAYDISDYSARMQRMEQYVIRLADELARTGVLVQASLFEEVSHG